MSANQESNQTQAPKTTQLCKMGCGFFGSDATGNCCSKCFMESIKTKASAPTTTTPAAAAAMVCSAAVAAEESSSSAVSPMDVDDHCVTRPTAAAPKKKNNKKKKKMSYKNMMNSMMAGDTARDVQQEQREKISQGVGGGAFTKIEKI